MKSEGHRQSYKMGILHREVSEGNILIVDGQPLKGFIHDFDYSSFYRKAMGELKASGDMLTSDKPVPLSMSDDVDEMLAFRQKARREEEARELLAAQNIRQASNVQAPNELKERTGTLQFMSIVFLDLRPGENVVHLVQHDLESFYWVLMWIVLRHTRHKHPLGADACQRLFDQGDEFSCRLAKEVWLNRDRLVVTDNGPLTDLIGILTDLVARTHPRDSKNPRLLDYDSVLHVFEKLLQEDGWPTDDTAIPFKPVDTSREAPA
ncbi:hypothetical protein B0H21DRAFT_893563 [Amylocystis lapponica]|nr:hypothetical protein B0H21DRAFT_893563 [Amylocystis lapponica]